MRNFHVPRPAAQPLISCDALGENAFIGIGKIRLFRPGDLGGRRVVHVGPGLPVGACECPGHIGLEPVTSRRNARETARADLLADLRHDMSDAIGLQLLRVWALLLDILSLALAEGPVDLAGAAEADGFDLVEGYARLVARVLEHIDRLARLEHDDFGAFKAGQPIDMFKYACHKAGIAFDKIKPIGLGSAIGWPALNMTTSAPSSFFHVNAGSASRPVRKNPSISLIWAK